MTLEWLYLNLVWVIVILIIAILILFLFPILLGKDLLKKSKNKK